jgi:NAD(P)-dependent dehydrogenase (short-subunit alcohol dehydrogenase family)
MNIDLQGKTAVVTGSTAGIGFAIAQGLAECGARAVINGRSEDRVARAVEQIKSKVPRAQLQGVAADLGTAEGAALLQQRIPVADILVNNLGIVELKPFFDIGDEDWERFFRVNVLSGIRLARFYTQGMMQRGWGRVIFISSESGLQVPAEMVHYGMTKTAQMAVARGLAETVAGTGVTVNSVLPGTTRSEGVERFVEQMGRHSGKSFAQLEKEMMDPSSLLRRFATVEEVANMVVYLASEYASATTGAGVRVDGGTVRAIV